MRQPSSSEELAPENGAFSLGQVRELLSTPEASRFFEAWGQAQRAADAAAERLDDLEVQSASAAGRIHLLEQQTLQTLAEAEAERRRHDAAPADPPWERLEARARAEALTARAATLREQAIERRVRAQALADDADRVRTQQAGLEATLRALRLDAALLGGWVGQETLFFPDASEAGGAFVIPLRPVSNGSGRVLQALVLHRLGPGQELAGAQPVRDEAAPAAAETTAESPTPEATPPAAPACDGSLLEEP